ncbi:MAG: MazG nucleotide pyrophosphohydrolase domain-containing protein [Candidatus Caldarchaeum sp.]
MRAMDIRSAQKHLDEVYGDRDRVRGVSKTLAWLVSEVGELAEAIVQNLGDERLREEAADVAAWLLSLCNIASIDLEAAFLEKYGSGCPRCGSKPCACPMV